MRSFSVLAVLCAIPLMNLGSAFAADLSIPAREKSCLESTLVEGRGSMGRILRVTTTLSQDQGSDRLDSRYVGEELANYEIAIVAERESVNVQIRTSAERLACYLQELARATTIYVVTGCKTRIVRMIPAPKACFTPR